jgi:hypothetical protein
LQFITTNLSSGKNYLKEPAASSTKNKHQAAFEAQI